MTEFLFKCFSSFGWQHRLIFFVASLTLYLLTLSGNVIVVTITRLDYHLYTPMNFFMSMNSISMACYTVAIIPHMLSGLLCHQPIAIQGCATQLFFYLTLVSTTASCSQPWDMITMGQSATPYSIQSSLVKSLCAVCIWVTGNWCGHGHCPSNTCVLPPFL